MTTEEIEHRFTYHEPPDCSAVEKYTAIRMFAKTFAKLILVRVPEGREQSLAITKLEEVVMWANAGIARE